MATSPSETLIKKVQSLLHDLNLRSALTDTGKSILVPFGGENWRTHLLIYTTADDQWIRLEFPIQAKIPDDDSARARLFAFLLEFNDTVAVARIAKDKRGIFSGAEIDSNRLDASTLEDAINAVTTAGRELQERILSPRDPEKNAAPPEQPSPSPSPKARGLTTG